MEITPAARLPIVSQTRDVSFASYHQPDPSPASARGRDGILPSKDESGASAQTEAIQPSDVLERRVEISPTTHDIVYKKINERNGEIVQQYPDQAILRLRAYLHAADAQATAAREAAAHRAKSED